MFGWVLFRAPSFPAARAMYRALLGIDYGRSYPVLWLLRPETIIAFICGVVFSMPVLPRLAQNLTAFTQRLHSPARSFRLIPVVAAVEAAGLVVALIAASFRVVSGTYNPFIYFRF